MIKIEYPCRIKILTEEGLFPQAIIELFVCISEKRRRHIPP